MKSAALFIHSRYPKAQIGLYRNLCRGKFKIAVDGGYLFFRNAKIKPDIIIGDFDSIKKKSVKKIKTLAFPKLKDQTDTELAVRYCIDNNFKSIDIVMPTIGEPDHFMGLISLLANPKVRKLKVRIVNHKFEIKLLENEKLIMNNRRGNKFSIKAVCKPIKLTCTGTKFDCQNLAIHPWQTTGLRNEIDSIKSAIAVKGRALIFHYHRGKC